VSQHDPSQHWLTCRARARAATQLVSWKITFYMPCIMPFLIKETIALCREEFIPSGVATYTRGWSRANADRHTQILQWETHLFAPSIFIFPGGCPRSAHKLTDCIASEHTQIAKRRGCRFALVQFQVAWCGAVWSICEMERAAMRETAFHFSIETCLASFKAVIWNVSALWNAALWDLILADCRCQWECVQANLLV
jgi:hypothetical protein